MPPKKQPNKGQPNYTIYKYTVIQFDDEDEEEKLFECIPDSWFLDETKSRCYWPPSTGAPFSVRAMRCEKPDDSWNIYDVIVVSDGHVSYNSGFKIVREKCSQKYNTSSAEEHIDAENYRRKHPVLSMQKEGNGSIEHVFSKSNDTLKKLTGKKHNAVLSSKKDLTTDSSVQDTNSNFDDISSIAGSSQNLDFGNYRVGETELDLNLDCGNENLNDVRNDDMSMDGRNADTIAQTSSSNDVHSTINLATVSALSSSIRSRSNESKSSRSRCDSLVRRSESIKSPERQSCSQSPPSEKQHRSRSRSIESVRSASSHRHNENHRRGGQSMENRKKSNFKPKKSSNCFNGRAESIESNVTNHSSRSHSFSRSKPRTSVYHSQPNRQHVRSRSRSASTRTVRQKQNREKNRHHHYDIPQNLVKKPNQSSTNGKSRRPSKGNKNVKSHRSRSRYRRNSSDNSRSRSGHSRSRSDHSNRSHCDLSKHGSRQQLSDDEGVTGVTAQRKQNANNSDSITDLINVVQKLNETLSKNNQQLKEYDRRLHRMEITVNKIFVLVGDLNGNAAPIHELENNHGFEIPKLPIKTSNELAVMKRKLKDKEFRDFFLQHERGFCCPTRKSTDTVTMSKYLTRFVSLRVRSKLTLKEVVDNGATLFKDYNSVYQFLIDVMRAGYRFCHRIITNDDAHSALRIVWGRSKQYYREEQDRSQR